VRLTENRRSYRVEHNLNEVDLLSVASEIDAAFNEIVQPYRDNAQAQDLIGVAVHHEQLSNSLFLSFVPNHQFDCSQFTNKIFKLSQSNQRFLLDGVFTVTVSVLKHTSAGAPSIRSVADSRKFSKSLIEIVSELNECGYIAISLGYYRKCEITPAAWSKAKRSTCNFQFRLNMARDLIAAVNESQQSALSIESPLSYDGIETIAKHLGMRVVVYRVREDQHTSSAVRDFKTLQSGDSDANHIFLELLERNDGTTHYNLITNIARYLGNNFRKYCFRCYKPYQHQHACHVGCPGCGAESNCDLIETMKCDHCGHSCRSMMCLSRHKQTPTCSDRFMCPQCEVQMMSDDKKNHNCLKYKCRYCHKDYSQSPHYCFLQPIKPKMVQDAGGVSVPVPDPNIVMVSFDCESMFQKIVNSNGIEEEHHVPNLLCAIVTCNNCYQRNNVLQTDDSGNYLPLKSGWCDVCLEYKLTFYGVNCVRDFTEYLFNVLADHINRMQLPALTQRPKIRVFAHNFGRYDGRFILKDFFDSSIEKSEVIMQGTRILSFDVGPVRFQDSLNLFLCALRKLPSTYGFSERVVKGCFPYAFNTPENQHYVGRTPPLSAYGYDTMKPEDQAQLKLFHDSIKDRDDWDMDAEIVKYCMADTEILHIGLMEWRQSIIDSVKFDCIVDYFTLPSVAFATYRRMFLNDLIGITPIHQYGKRRISSMISNAWLDWVQHSDPSIKLNREQQLGRVFADAFDSNSQKVYEFLGCFWHGCTDCFTENRDSPRAHTSPITHDQALRDWHDKLNYYQKLRTIKDKNGQLILTALEVVAVKECEFREAMQHDINCRNYVNERLEHYKRIKAIGHCDLRESYFGGRTNNAKFYADFRGTDSRLEFVDFNSLYPAVLVQHDYMLGHPTVITENFHEWMDSESFIKPIFGFVKCKVLPPKQLMFPILPMQFNGRLEFSLCGTCSESNAKSYCQHDDDERAMTWTWATPELEEALKNGYRIIETYEILHWRLKGKPFNGFVYCFTKMKAEASGYPSWVQTEADKDKYISDYYDSTGIQLDKSHIKRDEVKRLIAKIMLNSFYGKFAQRTNMESTAIIKTYEQMWQLATDPEKIVTGMISVGTNVLLVNSKMAEDDDARQGNVNVAIASFVTSYARLKLWRQLNELHNRRPGCVYYYDTDSIFYSADDNMELLQTGPYLGDLTAELKPHEVIKQAAFLGPKNYAYVIRNTITGAERVIVKVKGITIDAKALQTLTIERMTEMAKAYCHDNTTIEQHITQNRIRSLPDQTIINQKLSKLHRAVSEKRLIDGNDTYPRGWVQDIAEGEAVASADTDSPPDLSMLDQFIAFMEQ
jgi:hypothetical protein